MLLIIQDIQIVALNLLTLCQSCAFGNKGRRGRKTLKLKHLLLHLSKANIIRLGIEHGVDYSQTVSCYQADAQGRACGKCDSCRLRPTRFYQTGIADPTRYTQ